MPPTSGDLRIVFRQRGGYAGLVLGTELDSDHLTPEEAAGLRSLRGTAPHVGRHPSPRARDIEIYEIRLEGDPPRTFVFDQLHVPEGVEPLLERLKKEAGGQNLA